VARLSCIDVERSTLVQHCAVVESVSPVLTTATS
jgi:hypothetical protein